MTAADQAKFGTGIGDVEHGRGDEGLRTVVVLRFTVRGAAVVHCDPVLQVPHQLGQPRFLVRQSPECAQYAGGFTDRIESLAASIADDHAGAVGGAGERVQIAAQLRLRLCGQVDRGDAQGAAAARQGLHQHVLCRLRHRAQLRHLLLVPFPQVCKQRDKGRDQTEGNDLVGVIEVVEAGACDGHHGLGEHGDRAHEGSHTGAGERRGHSGRCHEKRTQVDVRRRADVHHGDGGDQGERHRHECLRVPPGRVERAQEPLRVHSSGIPQTVCDRPLGARGSRCGHRRPGAAASRISAARCSTRR